MVQSNLRKLSAIRIPVKIGVLGFSREVGKLSGKDAVQLLDGMIAATARTSEEPRIELSSLKGRAGPLNNLADS